ADFHGGNTFIPSGDDLTGANLGLERTTAIDGAVELGAVGQPASVVNGHGLTLLRARAISYGEVFVLQTGWSCDVRAHLILLIVSVLIELIEQTVLFGCTWCNLAGRSELRSRGLRSPRGGGGSLLFLRSIALRAVLRTTRQGYH